MVDVELVLREVPSAAPEGSFQREAAVRAGQLPGGECGSQAQLTLHPFRQLWLQRAAASAGHRWAERTSTGDGLTRKWWLVSIPAHKQQASRVPLSRIGPQEPSRWAA